MLLRKTTGVLLAAFLFAASLSGLFAAPLRSASAETSPVTLTSDLASLFLPETYEQYLSLSSPTSVAMSEDYIAVADGSKLYIYDRADGTYSAFSHFSFTQSEKSANISKVQIFEVEGADNDRIFFSDVETHLYEYETEKASKEMIVSDVPAQTFIIDSAGKTLYTANAAADTGTVTIACYALNNEKLTNEDATGKSATLESAISPNLAFENNVLYVAYNNTNLAQFTASDFNDKSEKLLSSSGNISGLQSVCAFNGSVYYTVKNSETGKNGLYRSTSNAAEFCSLGEENANEGLSALSVYKDELYCIRGTSVLKLNVNEDGTVSPADYEIAASSSSVNRLNGATDVVRAGDLLVTADAENDRISVYDLTKKSFEVLPCEDVKYVATDGEVIAAASDTNISVFEPVWDIASRAYVLKNTATLSQNNLAGIVCVHGAFYFVTRDYNYGTVTRGDEDEKWVLSHVQRGVGTTPKAITADLFGDIYVADNDGKVYKFSEDDFATEGALGESVADLDKDFSSLRAGFDGKLYYLDGDKKLCVFDGTEMQTITTVDGQNFVYTGDTEKKPTSFALGFEDDEVYFLFGDFIVKSEAGALGLDTLETLSEEALTAAAEDLAAVHAPEETYLAEVGEKKVGVRVNFGALGEEDSLFCGGYTRRTSPRRGVVLAEYEGYSLVALYEDHLYTMELFRTGDIGEKTAAPFEPADEERYLASDCTPYNYPCIADPPACADALPRGSRVRVLAVVREGGQEEELGGYDFAYIEYEPLGARSVRLRGYVPLAYITAADPLGDEKEDYRLGYVKPGAVFTGDDGSEVTVTERTLARIIKNEDGTYTARYEKDGVAYTATVQESEIEWGESDALRIALIIILSVLAAVIIGAYVFLLPIHKKQKS